VPIAPLVHHDIMIFLNKNDHTPGEDHDEQYCAFGIHQKGGCAAEKCILELWAVGTCGLEFLRMYYQYQYTITPWKINVKILIHINTNMMYNMVPLAVLVWSFRMSAMYFALYAAKMTHIDNFSIPILRQSHYWYTMRS